jgi:hypothetical protein
LRAVTSAASRFVAKALLTGLLAACVSASGPAQTGSGPVIAGDSTALVRQFVQDFYDHYTAVAVSHRSTPAWYDLLTMSSKALSPGLLSGLRQDSVAREQPVDTRMFLDFDPFLHSQDPCPLAQAVRVEKSGSAFLVPVRMCTASSSRPAEVVVEVLEVSGSLQITNVHYGKSDLVTSLCQWAMQDTRKEMRPVRC